MLFHLFQVNFFFFFYLAIDNTAALNAQKQDLTETDSI